MRWPLAPLEAKVGLTRLALLVDRGAVSRARRDGLSDLLADRWAVRCGLHPFEVWPEMAEHAIDAVLVPCAAGGCSTPFAPVRANQRYCGRPCQERERNRRRRQRPEFQASERARAAAYYAACGDYVRARERRRYQPKSARSIPEGETPDEDR